MCIILYYNLNLDCLFRQKMLFQAPIYHIDHSYQIFCFNHLNSCSTYPRVQTFKNHYLQLNAKNFLLKHLHPVPNQKFQLHYFLPSIRLATFINFQFFLKSNRFDQLSMPGLLLPIQVSNFVCLIILLMDLVIIASGALF